MRFFEKNTAFKGYTDYTKMIDEVSPDGIMINVPNAFHFDIAKYCIEQGLNIFVEKPLTLSYENSTKLVQLAVERGIKGQVGYVNRYNPVFKRVKHFLEHKAIGDITSYINRMAGGVILKKNSKGWRNDYAKGGGCLFDYGSHCFDLSTYFFGTDVKVQSSVLKRVFSTNVDDIVYATLLHNSGVVGFNYINWSDGSVRKATNSIEIMGTKGKILANKQEMSVFMEEENQELKLKKGWNQLYLTDENTNVHYYLRGEEFSLQMVAFSNLLDGRIDEPVSSLFTASITDKLLEDTLRISGELQ